MTTEALVPAVAAPAIATGGTGKIEDERRRAVARESPKR